MKFLKHNESLADQYKEWSKNQKDVGDVDKSKVIEDIKGRLLDIFSRSGFISIKVDELSNDPIKLEVGEDSTTLIRTLYQDDVEIQKYDYDYIDENSIDEYELEYEHLDLDILDKILEILKNASEFIYENNIEDYKQWLKKRNNPLTDTSEFDGYGKLIGGKFDGEFMSGPGTFVWVVDGVPDVTYACDIEEMGTDEDAVYGLESDAIRYGAEFEYPIMDVTGNESWILAKDLKEPYRSAYAYSWVERNGLLHETGLYDCGNDWGHIDLDKIKLAYKFYN